MRTLERAFTNVHSANQRERVAAVVALAQSATPAAVEPLISALGDEDAEVRLNASAGLGALGTTLRDDTAAARARSALQEYRARRRMIHLIRMQRGSSPPAARVDLPLSGSSAAYAALT